MLITKFNKMIRNRIVWWIIGGIVIVTFVGFFSPRGGCEDITKIGQVGQLDGQPVTDAEIRQARFNTYLELCLMTGRMLRINPAIDKELREEAWRRIAAVRTANKLNLTVSRNEVLSTIVRNPDFQENGTFSKARYQQFVRGTLGNLDASAAQFEAYLKESILLQKLHNLTSSAAWVAPSTLQRLVARYADKFSIEYVTLNSNSIIAADIKLSDEDLRAYYTANTNEFEVAAKVAVRYVSFPISNNLAKATVTSDAIDSYYDTHTDEFSSTDTNGTRTVTPLENVRSVISNQLLWAEATQAARDKATDMIISLAPARDGTATPFEKAVADLNLTVLTSSLFNATAAFPGIENSHDLVATAFRLRPTQDEYFSDPVAAADHIYVMALATNTEPYVPAFETVRDDVVAPARTKAAADALKTKAANLHRLFAEGLKQKESFTAVARQQILNVSTSGYFTAYSAPDALSAPEVFEELSSRNPGELTDIIHLDDAYLIAHVVDRQPGSVDDINAVRTQMGTSNVRRQGRIIFTEFQNYLLRSGGKTDTIPAPEPEDAQ